MAEIFGATENDKLNSMAGSAYLDNQSFRAIERICDEGGGRTAGNEENKKAIVVLKYEPENIGLRINLEKFKMPADRLTPAETANTLIKFNLDDRLKWQGELLY